MVSRFFQGATGLVTVLDTFLWFNWFKLPLFSAVFTWNHLLVAIAECLGGETEALDLVPAVTSAVLEEHHLIVGAVVIVDPRRVTTNSRGEKQRNLLRDQFLNDHLNPIYVAYNS